MVIVSLRDRDRVVRETSKVILTLDWVTLLDDSYDTVDEADRDGLEVNNCVGVRDDDNVW